MINRPIYEPNRIAAWKAMSEPILLTFLRNTELEHSQEILAKFLELNFNHASALFGRPAYSI
jgi:hypothetical protein